MVATMAFFRCIMETKFKVILFLHEVVRMKCILGRFQDTTLLKKELRDFLATQLKKNTKRLLLRQEN